MKELVKKILLNYYNKQLHQICKNSTIKNNKFNNKVFQKESILGNNIQLVGNLLSGDIKIGDNAWIHNCTITASQNTKIEIGKYTLIQGGNTQIVSIINDIKIGNYCTIGLNAQLISGNHRVDTYTTSLLDKRINGGTSKNTFSLGKIILGHDCTIGLNSFIMPGVTLGNGCLVMPNSTVTSSFEPFSIIAGNPATCIGKRFSKQKVEYLEKLNYYEWEHDKIIKNLDTLLSRVSVKREFCD